METKRLRTRNLLQRVVTLSKQTTDQQTSTNLTIPLWNKALQGAFSVNSDVMIINPIPQLPTYILSPPKRFDFSRAQKLLQLELSRRCGTISRKVRYDPKLSFDLVHDLAHQLRRVIKPAYLNFLRYKIIVLVSIIQTSLKRQIHPSMAIVSRCLWNTNTDGSVTVKASFGYDMIAIATAFIIYTD